MRGYRSVAAGVGISGMIMKMNEAEATTTFGKSCNTNDRLWMIALQVALYFYFVYCTYTKNQGSWTLHGAVAFNVPLLLLTVFASQKFWVCKPGELTIETSSLVERSSIRINTNDIASVAVVISDGGDTVAYDVKVICRSGETHFFVQGRQKPVADAFCQKLRSALLLEPMSPSLGAST